MRDEQLSSRGASLDRQPSVSRNRDDASGYKDRIGIVAPNPGVIEESQSETAAQLEDEIPAGSVCLDCLHFLANQITQSRRHIAALCEVLPATCDEAVPVQAPGALDEHDALCFVAPLVLRQVRIRKRCVTRHTITKVDGDCRTGAGASDDTPARFSHQAVNVSPECALVSWTLHGEAELSHSRIGS